MKKLFLALVIALGVAVLLQRRSPSNASPGDFQRLEGLLAGVRVLEDSDGVPHVYAQNDRDAMFVMGYLHARDRLFQMDVLRKLFSGRLAELLGQSALSSDIQLRTIGLHRAAALSYDAYSPLMQTLLGAYSRGVNAHVSTLDPLPPEYQALELTRIEPWPPLDSAIVVKGLLFGLSFDLGDVSRTDTLSAYEEAGDQQGFDGSSLFFDDLFRNAPFDPSVSIPAGTASNQSSRASARPASVNLRLRDAIRPETLRLIRKYRGRLSQSAWLDRISDKSRFRGSNWWLIGASNSQNGVPLFANDPHLTLDTPATFYEIHLNVSNDASYGPMNVNGVSFAGAPLIAQGCNDRICWGSTVNPMDVTDVFEESLVVDLGQLRPTHTRFEDGTEELVVIPQTFRVNQIGNQQSDDLSEAEVGPLDGGLTFLVPRRNMGPLFAVEVEGFSFTGLSLQYTGLSPTRDGEAFYHWTRARDVDDFKEGLQYFDFGSQTWAYADVDGRIAYFTSGEMPLREDLQNLGRVDGLPPYLLRNGGHQFQNEWLPAQAPSPQESTGYQILPFEEMPQVIDPDQGYITSGNNDPVGTTLDNDVFNQFRPGGGVYYLSPGYSSLRMGRLVRLIEEKLAQGEKLSLQDMIQIQGNNQLLDAEILLPYLLQAHQAALGKGVVEPLAELGADPILQEAIDRLADWNFSTPTGLPEGYDPGDDPASLPEPSDREVRNSVAATIYSVWRGQLLQSTIDAALQRLGLGGHRPDSERSMSALRNLLDGFAENRGVGVSGIDFFEVDGLETPETERDFLLLKSLQDALNRLKGEAFAPAFDRSEELDDYRWGRLHRIVFDHRLGAPFDVPEAAGFTHLGEDLPGVARAGGYEVVDASSHSARADSVDSFMFGSGPARRFVAELFPQGIQARQILAGGQSGRPQDAHYASQLNRWLTNQYHPLRLSQAQAEEDASRQQTFLPVKASLFFPFYQGDGTRFTGFSFSSLASSLSQLVLEARDEGGNKQPFAGNPAQLDLNSLSQRAQLGSEIFQIPASSPQQGWVEVTARVQENGPALGPSLASFTQFGSFDLKQLDGGVAFTELSKRLLLTRVFEGKASFRGRSARTFLSLANPTQESIQVEMVLFADSTSPSSGPSSATARGQVSARDLTIPPKGAVWGSVSELWGEAVQVSDGYLDLRVRQGPGMVAFELIELEQESTLLGLNAQPPSGLCQAFSGQLAAGPDIFSNVSLINTSDQRRRVTLSAVDNQGADLVEGVDIELGPGGMVAAGCARSAGPAGGRWCIGPAESLFFRRLA